MIDSIFAGQWIARVEGRSDELASAAVRQGRLNLAHRIDVEDDQGDVMTTVTFGDAVEVTGQSSAAGV